VRLVEVKILYNADYHSGVNAILDTQKHIEELMYWVKGRPDVVSISRTIILPDGDHD